VRLPRSILPLVLAALAFSSARADVVTLTNGRKIEGTIKKEGPDGIEIETKIGRQTIPRDLVQKVEKTSADPKEEFARRKAALEKDPKADAAAWAKLGAFADEKTLDAEAKSAYAKALALDPDCQAARAARGEEKWQGTWLPKAEVARRKGLVEYQGRWVTPEEKEKLDQGFVQVDGGEWISKEALAKREEAERAKAEAAREALAGRGAGAPKKPEAGGAAGEPATAGPATSPRPAAKALAVGPAGEPPSPELLAAQLADQKADARACEQKLGLKFEDVEEGPLLVHTTCPKDSERFRKFLRDLGKIYTAETKTYALPFDAPIWPGKLQIYFFKDKDEFDRFATEVDDAAGAVQSGGYFIQGATEDGHVKLHITMFNLEEGTLAHELSHAFMSRYQYSGRHVIPWANEGTAEFMRLYVAELLELGQRDFRHRGVVKEMLLRNDERASLRTMMAKSQIQGTEVWAYAVSYTLVDFMVKADPMKFVRFLKLMKQSDGTLEGQWRPASVAEQTHAIEQAYGIPIDKFEASWKDYVRNGK
jgi:hypothetical protein